MATLRVTLTFPDHVEAAEQAKALAELAGDLREPLEPGQRLTRLGGLNLPGAAPAPVRAAEAAGGAGAQERIFKLEMPDGAAPRGVLRALGGWLMRHPSVSAAIKADGPGGGVSLRLTQWSALAYAAAVARLLEHLCPAEPQ